MAEQTKIYSEVPIKEAMLCEHGLTSHEQIILETGFNYICTGIDYPPEGGILVYFQGIPFPMKGLPNLGAVENLNIVKSIVMMLVSMVSKELFIACLGVFLLPFSRKVKLLSKVIDQFIRLANRRLDKHYLKPERYCVFAREVYKLTQFFLLNLGFSKEHSEGLAKVMAMFMEYDMVYRYLFQDLFSSVTEQEIKSNPRKTIVKMVGLLFNRLPYESRDCDNHVSVKVGRAGKLVSFLLLHPKIKKAFLQALGKVEFSRLQLDAGDRYYCLNNGNFEAFGMPLYDRMKIYAIMHKNGYPPYQEYRHQPNY